MAAAIATTAKRPNPKLVETFIAPEVVLVVAAAALDPVRSGMGDEMAEAFTPPRTVPLSVIIFSLPPIANAAFWYVVKEFPTTLIAPTIPIPQCPTCLQKYQTGVVSVTLMVKVAEFCKPESNPAEEFVVEFAKMGVHGSAKVD